MVFADWVPEGHSGHQEGLVGVGSGFDLGLAVVVAAEGWAATAVFAVAVLAGAAARFAAAALVRVALGAPWLL